MTTASDGEAVDPFDSFRQFFALQRDVLVLSLAMFAFSLSFQMTGRYIPKYLTELGASDFVVGLYGSLGLLIGAVYPYPGGAISDRIGSRLALTLFGLASTVGFAVWVLAPVVGTIALGPVALPAWLWVFLGLFLAQGWKSLGLGATFAIVKQSVPPSRLAAGFAATETFRRIGFLVGPLFAALLLASVAGFVAGFQVVLLLGVGFALVATVVQHLLYDPESDTVGSSFEGVESIVSDLRSLPEPLRPLLVADSLVRFANGMVHVFVVLVVTDFLAVEATILGRRLAPEAFFGVLLSVEMAVALLTMIPVAKLAERVGLKPVVAVGFVVYSVFPALLVVSPADPLIVGALFAFSGLRFAGLPAHKALIVGPAEAGAGGRITGSYYLVRDAVRIPSATIGGWLFAVDPQLAFALAAAVGLAGTGYFLVAGEEFEAYQ